jgi:iron complex transport system substrate-binding protein
VACEPAESSQIPNDPIDQPVFPITVQDQAGRTITFNEAPQKIISLSPSNTEIIYALGLEDRLYGVTTFCNYPPAAQDKPKIGGFSTADIERITEIQPDLILASNIHLGKNLVSELENRGYRVLVLRPINLDEVIEAFELVSRITGQTEETTALVTDLKNRINTVTSLTAGLTDAQKKRVFYVTTWSPIYSVGSDTLIHNLIVSAGGINIYQELSGTISVGFETIIDKNPQVMVAGGQMGGAMPAYDALKTDSLLATVEARVTGQIYQINADLVNRYGPRVVDALEQLAQMIHPELFGPLAQ